MKHYPTTLKNSLLATALGVCVTMPATTAADLEQDPATPTRNASALAVHAAEQTPGARVNVIIQSDLTKEKLLDVIGVQAAQDLGLNLDILADLSIPFDDQRKKSLLLRIKNHLDGRFRKGLNTPNLNALRGKLNDVLTFCKGAHLDRIEELFPKYLLTVHHGCSVSFVEKHDGVQLGTQAIVTLANGQTVKYYIKTHSGGLTSEKSSAPSLVNPSELLVYKVLEGLGVGPQCHFFGRDGNNMYIATLDAGTQLNSDGTVTQVPFKEYAHFKDDRNSAAQAQLWGDLSQLPDVVDFSDAEHQQAEEIVNTEGGIAKNFVREVAKLDVLARIMRLSDFQTNPGNYGFVQEPDGRLNAKAIDFRLNSTDLNEIRFGEYFFKGFLEGNGYFDYSSTGKAMYYALRKRQPHLRVHEATTIMAEELRQFDRVVDAACQHVSGTLMQVPMTTDDQSSRQRELDQYAKIIKSNFKLFRDQLQKWRPATTGE